MVVVAAATVLGVANTRSGPLMVVVLFFCRCCVCGATGDGLVLAENTSHRMIFTLEGGRMWVRSEVTCISKTSATQACTAVRPRQT